MYKKNSFIVYVRFDTISRFRHRLELKIPLSWIGEMVLDSILVF